MDKLKLHTPNFTDENTTKIAALFPHCVSEGKIDFELLKQELSSSIIEGAQERYQLGWVGKREALLNANAPIAKTLRPCREESVNFDTTENLYIEGDNLDALKLLQETYLNKVKMIYIDPPYNTGNDFIYEDDFAENTADYLQRSNQKDESGNRLTANPESNGRFHSDWLSMMYPRLKLARNLLSDDGVIFISIDDNEQANLKRLCDEVFGEDNHIATIANVNNPKGRSDDRFIATAHESLVFFAKNKQDAVVYGFELEENITRRYNKNDEFGDYREIDLRKTGDNDKREDRPNLFYYFYFNQITGELYPSREEQKIDGFIQIKPLKDTGEDGNWRWGFDNSQNNTLKLIARYMPNRKIWGVFEKDYLEGRSLAKPTSAWTFKEVNSERGSEAFIQLNFDKKVFPRPKPLGLIHRILNVSVSPKSENDIILDFFSGSATTAHAVMQLNAEDGGKRKFIMVQIPEACDEKSEAFKAGYKTIADIGKERIRRAGQKIKTDNPLTAMDLDIGFRVLKVDSSNMNEVYYSPDTLNREDLHQFVENIRNDRSDEDLLFQVLLDWGVDLTLPITSQVIDGKTVFIVAQDAIVACFDRAGGVSETFIKELAAIKPLRAVFCDSGFANDSVKINVEQIFKMMSPSTDIKTI